MFMTATLAGNKLQCRRDLVLPHDVQPAPCAAFLENCTDVELCRTSADAELRSNLFIGESSQDEPENLSLPSRELQGRVCADVVFRKTPGDVLIYMLVEHLHRKSYSL